MAGKVQVARRERLHRVCKNIIADPSSIDAGTVAQFKSAALKYVASQYADTTQGFKDLYKVEGELGDLVRGAFDVVVSKRLDNMEISPLTGAAYNRTRLPDLDDDDDDDDDEKDDVMTDNINKAHRDRGAGPHGLTGALLEHLHDRLERRREQHGYTKSVKEEPMDKTETLRDIAKAGGIIAVAKAIVDENRSYGISEHEFVALATEHAKAAHPELTEAAAFAKLYQIPEVWRACELLKTMPFVADFTPLVVGGEANRGGDVNPDDPAKAIEQLKELGRRRWPSESESQQFERALTAPENHKLARLAVPIPRANTSYPFPR
jgi:hypothetical protein